MACDDDPELEKEKSRLESIINRISRVIVVL